MTEKFTPEELHLIINTLSKNTHSAQQRENIGKSLALDKEKGIKIDEALIEKYVKANQSKNPDDYFHSVPKIYKIVEYK